MATNPHRKAPHTQVPDASIPVAPRRPRARGSLLAVSIVPAGLALAACGKSDPPPTILNTEKVERAIEASSLEQRNKRVQASCPSGVHQKKGLEFSCTAFGKNGNTRFVVTQRDGAGRVHYEAR